ncbi:hypothetical protein BDY24DRAFT_437574 [Mrakia frigida]|uniref:uncharacterized protein n=1 Tax=Mrakia frigida TaxID=29902 RepID=UPI003FCC21F5
MLRSTGNSRTVSRLGRLSSSPFAISRRAHSSSPPPSSSSYLPLPSQIHVLPFSIPPELALKRLAAFSIATSYSPSALFAWIGHQLLPSIFKDRIPLVNHQMIYIPAWSVQAKVTTKVTVVGEGDKLSVLNSSDQAVGWGEEAEDEMARMAEEEEKERKKNDGKRVFKLGVDSEFSFFPGTSSYPISHLSFQPTLPELPEHLPFFNPSRHLEQYGQKVTPFPFDSSPLVLPELIRNAKSLRIPVPRFFDANKACYHFITAPRPGTDKEDAFLVEDTEKDVVWEQLDATPLYLPFYLAKYEFEGKESTLLLEATNDDAGNCEVYIPHPKGKDAPYPETPYGRVLFKPHPPYPTSSPLTVGQTPFLQPSHFDLEPLSVANPSNTDPNSPEGNDLSPQMSDVFRLVLKQVEDLEKHGDESATATATRMDRLRSAKRKDWEKEVPEEMREKLDKEREGRQEATRKWVKAKVLGRREEAWAWAVARMGDEMLARSGREEIRRLSLKGGKEGEEGVGKIVRWVGTEEQGEVEED